ncbi:M28 family metallopeptidase [Longimicrobium sp.]|uniref:M28 family metallopeptidase n=1 Tax=Longimicrobium sp. TaxID=2029185 RepID=UPI002CE36286|nr:M28 family peptidase [Longimicrobium sp.]HSU16822.1 M28 family peptidase [Longimicrobium sp.]
MRRRLPILLRLAAVLAAAPLAAQPAASRAAVDRAARSITVSDVRARIAFLAGDALKGRDTPSPGLTVAAESIAAVFRAAGLRPAGGAGGFVQQYRFQGHPVAPAARRLGFRAADGTAVEWAYERDYFAFGALHPAESAEAVYAGAAAMHLPPLPGSVRGKVVIYSLPGTLIEGVGMLSTALTAGLSAGAAGVLLVADPVADADSMAWFSRQMEASGVYTPGPVGGLRYDAARALFRAAGLDLDSLRARPAGEPIPLRGVRLTIEQPAVAAEVTAPNVVAILPGSDPALRGEYVVISAHFDHVGTGRPDAHGDSIFNGADDNASGTVALLEAARAFARLPRTPARSILFLAVSGEERGLKGSAYWVQHPTVPIARVVADLNLDMVGRNAPDTLYLMGQEYSSLGPAAHRVAAAHPELGFRALPSQADPKLQWFSRSDHVAFIMAGVPVLFFTTLPHPDYHRLSDEPSHLDAEKLTRVSRMLFYVAHAVASERARPAWTASGLNRARAAIK